MMLRRAFSLVEALVAVAAIAVIGAALATVFQSVGDTVTGGRELSRFNSLATRIEQQMREDIEAMSRDGFLLIRHVSVGATAADPQGTSDDPDVYPVFLAADDPEPRARRADELLFFANGRFETARPPVTESLPNARSSTARIYYGHGVRLPDRWRYPRNVDGSPGAPPIEVTDDRFVGDPFSAAGGPDSDAELRLGGSLASGVPLGERGPNEFASDWTLLRHEALLVEPSGSYVPPAGLANIEILGVSEAKATAEDVLRESAYQIGGQVAAFTPFRTLQVFVNPATNPPVGFDPITARYNLRADVDGNAYSNFAGAPVMSSGLVDVLVGSLNGRYTGIRDVVTRFQVDPTVAAPVPLLPDNFAGVVNLTFFQERFGQRIALDGFLQQENSLYSQQLWMLDALPHAGPSRVFPTPGGTLAQIARMRYDDLAPGWREQLWNLQTGGDAREAALRLADQQMLGSSIFVPRCTEFIVEWSLGERVSDVENPRFGELVWHGLPRFEDLDRDGRIEDLRDAAPEPIVLPYPRVPSPVGSNSTNGEQQSSTLELPFAATDGYKHPPRLFHGPSSGSAIFASADPAVPPGPDDAFDVDQALGTEYDGGIELISAFGYFDPTSPTATDPVVSWPWPKLLRVTVRLAADNDPLNERTFQFVFEVPENGTL
ncbi:MAG: hypothetical protein AAGG07_04050 [Planctomycetota bacterium]